MLIFQPSLLQDTDFDSLVNKLNDCTDCLKSLETTAFQMLRELNGSMESRPVSLTQTQSIVNGAGELTAEDDSEEVTFDVKIETGLGGRGWGSRGDDLLYFIAVYCRSQNFRH